MSALTSFKRRLKPNKVYFAQKVAEKKIEFARNVVLERAKRDAEFATDVLKAVKDNLPTEIKEACEKSVSDAKTSEEEPETCIVCGGKEPCSHDFDKMNSELEAIGKRMGTENVPLGDGFVATQSDGGGPIIVHETEVPGYLRDGG